MFPVATRRSGMAIEIERKFLPVGAGWRAAVERTIPMTQGYLNQIATPVAERQRASVRVRIAGEDGFLNLKSQQSGPVRQEFEYPIPLADARALLALCVGRLVEKRRHLLRYGQHLWEIDEFLGDNAGLVVAEIELDQIEARFERPDWLGAEVTGLSRYYNLALAMRPFSRWSADERAASDA